MGGVCRGSPGIHQQEAPGAVSVLSLSRIEAGLTKERSLLIAEDGRHRNACEWAFSNFKINFAAGMNLRQHGARNIERTQKIIVPIEGCKVHQLRAARVSDIGDVISTAAQPP